MRIVTEITGIYPTDFKEREELLGEASRMARITLDEEDRVLMSDMVKRLAEDLRLERHLASDVVLEVLVELDRKAFLERDKRDLWLRRSL